MTPWLYLLFPLIAILSFIAGGLVQLRGVNEVVVINDNKGIRGTIRGNFLTATEAHAHAKSYCLDQIGGGGSAPRITLKLTHAILISSVYAFACTAPGKDTE